MVLACNQIWLVTRLPCNLVRGTTWLLAGVIIGEVWGNPWWVGAGEFGQAPCTWSPGFVSPKLPLSPPPGLSPPNSPCPPHQGLTQTPCPQYQHFVPSISIQPQKVSLQISFWLQRQSLQISFWMQKLSLWISTTIIML